MGFEYLLTKDHRIRLAQMFRFVPRVDLSIDCVIEGQMGRAFVDDLSQPSAFSIQVGPFLYFAGNPDSPGGVDLLQNIPPDKLLMPSATGWLEAAQAIYGERLLPHDRYSFSSERLSVGHLSSLLDTSLLKDKVRRMDLHFASSVWGQDHFVDLSDYDSPEDFIRRSVGFYIMREGEIAGAAYGSLVCSKGIEVSIYIMPEYRRQGMATVLAGHLLLWCLESDMDAHWDAANPESGKLALKLGYLPMGSYEAYWKVE